ncbi:MAG TPA: TIGR03435 family protein [Bryobacteraceae bacterium]
MTEKILRATLVAVACGVAVAQTPAKLSFEVASIKPAEPPVAGRMMVRMGGDPGRVTYTNVSLRDIIRNAYRLKDYQISAPDWVNNTRFDVSAKLPEGAKQDQVPEMLQSMLEERFKLTVHREKKDLPAYALVVAKSGLKMKESVEDPPPATGDGPPAGGNVALPDGPPKLGKDGMPVLPAGAPRGPMMMMNGAGHMTAKMMTIQSMADMLSRQLDQPVLDETGLKGKYDFALDYTPEPGQGRGMFGGMMPPPQMHDMPAGAGGAGPAPGGPEAQHNQQQAPPLQVAIQQQLGLKLDARKLPLELLVVDHMEKTPTEN